ncbi:sporulation protein [Sphingobium sp. SCG-1]|nr:sporulation protein [Sphingobium sp. SCG-1]
MLGTALVMAGGVPLHAVAQSGTGFSQLDLRQPDAAASLNSNLTRLGDNPRDIGALIGAGEAALDLNDPRAATGFFARADEIQSGNGRVKAGLGRAMLQLQNPTEALRLFDQAERLRYPSDSYIGDRALARDLAGDQAGAQRDYQTALRTKPNDAEVIKRYAVSLGISGQVDAAEKVIQPLLYKNDREAWRDRAFIFAMNGRVQQAQEITVKVMPKPLADAIQPYMNRMAALTPAERAAAVHFGNFPANAGVRMASNAAPSRYVTPGPVAGSSSVPQPASPSIPAARNSPQPEPTAWTRSQAAPTSVPTQVRGDRTRTAVPTPTAVEPSPIVPTSSSPPTRPPVPQVRVAETPRTPTVTPTPAPSNALPGPATASATPRAVQGPVDPLAARSTPANPVSQPLAPQDRPAQPLAQAATAPAPNPVATRTLADIIRELDVPDSETRPQVAAVDLTEVMALQARKREAARAAAEKVKRDAAAKVKAEADAKAKALAAEKARLAKNPSRNWVQVGTGQSVPALGFTLRGLRKKYDALGPKDAFTAPWGKTNRLVVGPFPSFAKAKDFEATLKKGGADVFAWQSEAGEEVMPIGGK